MEINLCLSHLNWLSIIVSTVVAFAIGGLWYSPVLFANAWMKELKITKDDAQKSNMPLIFGSTFVLEFIAAVLLDMFLGPEATLHSGIMLGLIVSLGWVATSIGTNYLFAQKSFKLFLIDAGYFVVWFTATGAILGAW